MYNVGNIKKVREMIRIYGPDQFDMSHWFIRTDEEDGHEDLYDVSDVDEVDMEDCQMSACIGGYCALVMSQEGYKEVVDFSDVGKWLGVPDAEIPFLFYRRSWYLIHPDVAEIANSTKSDYEAILEILDWMIERAEGVQVG